MRDQLKPCPQCMAIPVSTYFLRICVVLASLVTLMAIILNFDRTSLSVMTVTPQCKTPILQNAGHVNRTSSVERNLVPVSQAVPHGASFHLLK